MEQFRDAIKGSLEEISWIGIGLTDKTHDFPFLDAINLRTRPVAVESDTGEVIIFD